MCWKSAACSTKAPRKSCCRRRRFRRLTWGTASCLDEPAVLDSPGRLPLSRRCCRPFSLDGFLAFDGVGDRQRRGVPDYLHGEARAHILELGRLAQALVHAVVARDRSEEHTSELQSLMRTSYAVFCLKKKK